MSDRTLWVHCTWNTGPSDERFDVEIERPAGAFDPVDRAIRNLRAEHDAHPIARVEQPARTTGLAQQ